MNSTINTLHSTLVQEWLEADGRGGFASGTAAGIRTRRYHALLLPATTPPTGRMVLVNGFDAWIETPAGRFALTSQHYVPGVIHPDGAQRIENFTTNPWPTWEFKFGDGTRLIQELFVARDAGATVIRWRLHTLREGARLFVRPFLSGRDYHALHKENPSFQFAPTRNGEKVLWRPYDGVAGIYGMYSHNGHYAHDPVWYQNFLYGEEQARGLDCTEDLASPGIFEWDLSAGEAVWILTTTDSPALSLKKDLSVARFAQCLRENERARRLHFNSPLARAADDYLVTGRNGMTIVAGYPWFTDWGRDTFIALRGLCLATGRLDDAREILLAWAGSVSEGMLPNRFPDHGEQPEFNAVDASLWFIIAAHDLLCAADGGAVLSAKDRRKLHGSIETILEGYSKGTRFGIRADSDGLLASGQPGVQLTWMDARIGDWVVTPRIGKPVEVQALWLNALKIAGQFSPGWNGCFERGLKSFQERFWNPSRACLFDVVDANHRTGEMDASLRPNQIFTVGGLPYPLLEGERAKAVVQCVERHLLTPFGLRSLAPGEPGYTPRYEGGVLQRDGSYHQGTVWPWLLGPFVEAWLRVHGDTPDAKQQARERFIQPLLTRIEEVGSAHVPEIADAESPHTPRGCPFQAWSIGELLRAVQLTSTSARPSRKRPKEPVTT